MDYRLARGIARRSQDADHECDRPQERAGEEEKFKAFKWQLYVAARALNAELLTRLEWVERNVEEDYSMSSLDGSGKVLSAEAYTLLALLRTDQTLEHAKPAGENDMFEAWKQVRTARTLRSSVALLHQLLDPKRASSDPRVNIKQ